MGRYKWGYKFSSMGYITLVALLITSTKKLPMNLQALRPPGATPSRFFGGASGATGEAATGGTTGGTTGGGATGGSMGPGCAGFVVLLGAPSSWVDGSLESLRFGRTGNRSETWTWR